MVIFDLLSSSWSHLYSFSPLCFLWCRTRSSFWAKLLSHSSVLILKWLFLNVCFLKRCKFTIKNKSFITMATFKGAEGSKGLILAKSFFSDFHIFVYILPWNITEIVKFWYLTHKNAFYLIKYWNSGEIFGLFNHK